MKKKFLLATMILLLGMSGISAAEFPTRAIQGYIMWGAGGALDNVSRMATSLAVEHLGQTIIMQNRPGATGAIATTTVANLPANGYSVLFGAENPNLYRVTGISQIDYDYFDPVILLMANVGVVVVPNNSPFYTYNELIEAVATGTTINMGSTGPGGLPFVAASMIGHIHDVDFNFVQFDGEGPAVTALMGGHIDAVPVGLLAAAAHINAGSIRALAVISEERVESVRDVPTVVEAFPGLYEPFLPWGAFFGVFLRRGSPQEAFERLQEAYLVAFNDPQFAEFANAMGGVKLGLTGDAAREYIEQNKSVAAWLLYEAGGARYSPEQFDIPRPRE